MLISIHRPSLSLSFLTHFTFFRCYPIISPKNPLPLLSSRLTLASSMASTGDSENFSTVVADEDDVKYGFKRSEMYKTNLAGTVDLYDRHVFLCYKSHEYWPAKVEDSESDLLPMLFSVVLKNRKNDMNLKTRLTICERGNGMGLSDGDVLIFPDMIKYSELKESNVDEFVEDVLVNGNPWSGGKAEVLAGSYVFICAHNKRDRRCGVCGPILIETFKEMIESKGLKNQVSVIACSHVGGHKYAGNVIIFSADTEEKIAGHWYGYVTPDDVSELLDQHIGKSQIIDRLWRGQMGVEHVTEADREIPGVANETKLSNGEVKHETKEETTFSCCQGARGVSCCQEGSSDEKQGSKGVGRVQKWIGKWEQNDVVKALLLAGLVTAAAVGYRVYQKSK